MADLEPALAALRDGAAGDTPMILLSPVQARERVVAGNQLCGGGPAVDVRDLRPDEGPPTAVRVYEPVPPGVPVVTLVYAHGGGWVTGDLDYADELCRFLADTGLRVVSVDYRLAPEHPFPAALDDLADAWSWARQWYDGPLALGGDSAGGNLATALALRSADDCPASFLLLLYPVLAAPGSTPSYDTQATAFPIGTAEMRWFLTHYTGRAEVVDRADPDLFPLASGELDRLPPTHVVVAGHDPLHHEGLALAEALREAGVPVTTDRHDDLCHGFLRFTAVSPRAREARGAVVDAVRRLATDAGREARTSDPEVHR